MKNSVGNRNTKQAQRSAWKKVVFGVFLGVLIASGWTSAQEAPQKPGVSPEQEKRLEQMRSKGSDASLTILPIRVVGRPFDRVTEVVGALLERQGLKNIELGKAAFNSEDKTDMERLAVSLGEFIRKNPITTEYALYAEYNGNRQTGLDELRGVVVDKTGAVVWIDRLTPQDEAFKKLEDRDLMGVSVLLVERLSACLPVLLSDGVPSAYLSSASAGGRCGGTVADSAQIHFRRRQHHLRPRVRARVVHRDDSAA
jgi:hypothetical protein